MTNEIWNDIEGFEGWYQVSNLGRVRSFKYKTPRILKERLDKDGYAMVTLRKDNKSFTHKVHRLVATTFLLNPDNLPEVNHIDEVCNNNKLENLEWCSKVYNNNYGTKIQRMIENTDYTNIALKNSKQVLQYDLDGNLIKLWTSATECKREIGFDNSVITKCCNNKISSAYGYKWKYSEVI